MVRPSFIKGIQEEAMTIKDWIIEIFCYNKFTCFLRKIGRFILRLIRWIPVLYKQEEWDYSYVYDLIEFKMKELAKEISRDNWHAEHGINRALLQIKVCQSRLDRFRNWENYVDIPDIDWELMENEDHTYSMKRDEEYDKALLKAMEFEKVNYEKFWKDFIAWHNNWWT